MCGIFGVISNDRPVDENKVIAARDKIAHRGPDDKGIFITPDKRAALAHRRLSIIDLSSSGHQPMTTDDRYTIVFNGEIYNYREIQDSKLKTKNLNSNSDTEVLLDLYAEYGTECLKMLRGMFSFAIWDEKEKTLFAARDRFGKKPFYYYNDGNEFIFSSELKAIASYKNNLTTSIKAVDRFLRTGSIPAPLTIYNEVKSLLPGHFLVIRDQKLEISEYWSFNNLFSANSSLVTGHSSLKKRYDDDAKKKIRAALLDSVKAHMVADVEVGAFLSGGIDSTSIVSLMRQVGQEKIKTINISFPGNKLDEAKYARKAADYYSTANYEYNLTEHEVINELDNIFAAMDQPTIDGINTYFVSKAAKDLGLKVVLSGVGGDELFGGYPSFKYIPKLKNIKRIPLAKYALKYSLPLTRYKLPAKAIEYFKNPELPDAEYKLMRGLFTKDELAALGWQSNSLQSSVSSPQTINDSMNTNSFMTPLQYVSMMESTNYMQNQLLRDSDVFSMAHSLELRIPFVDQMLYQAVLPYLDSGFDKLHSKKMLIDAVGDLPREISHRSKMGFTFPFADWIKQGELKNIIIERLKNSELVRGYGLNIDHPSLRINEIHWSRLWALFVLSGFVR